MKPAKKTKAQNLAVPVRIAIDVMGGDLGLHSSLPAALACHRRYPDLHLTLVGCARSIDAALQAGGSRDGARLLVVDAPEVIAMDERPSAALRQHPRSSMRVAMELLAAGDVQALVSAGNTGALMALGMHLLGTLSGVDRPAICAPVPTHRGRTYLLDLGANVDCDAEQLHQFAILGSTLAMALEGLDRPDVRLLNIGREAVKGNDRVRLAATRIEADTSLEYRGFIEGDALFEGEADVVVCDGFVGNVALKVCEGTARLVRERLQETFRSGWRMRMLSVAAAEPLHDLYRQLDPQRYNGACFLGLNATVVKSHGNSSDLAFACAIERAVAAVRQELAEQLHSRWRH